MLWIWATTMGCGVPQLVPGVAEGPTPTPSGAQRLVFVGDAGDGTSTHKAVVKAVRQTCAQEECTAIVLLGDLLYPRGATGPEDPRLDTLIGVFATIAPTYLVLGNHDYGRGRDHEAVSHLQAWAATTPGVHLPSPTYLVDLGIGSLAIVDTNRVFQYGDEGQGAWLDGVLASPGWRIVAGHHPYRSNGPHGNAGQYEGWVGIPWMSGRSVAAFVENHVCEKADIYLSGHDHNLQVLQACGIDLAVSGSGSKVRELVDRGNTADFAMAIAGFMILDLTKNKAHLSVRSVTGESLYDRPL